MFWQNKEKETIRKDILNAMLSKARNGFNWMVGGEVAEVVEVFGNVAGKTCYWYNIRMRNLHGKFIVFFTEALSAYRVGRRLTHESVFEIVWTIVPGFVLVLLAIPSLKLLYSLDFILYDYEPIITIKVIGHQWYWSYEYTVFSENGAEHVNFDSYMVAEDDLGPGGLRLLEVDNPLVVPAHTYIRFLITAVDVLHCWAVPSLGIKVDAVPGRLNQVLMFIKRPGEFYGQCSEICGVNHGFMPIRLVANN